MPKTTRQLAVLILLMALAALAVVLVRPRNGGSGQSLEHYPTLVADLNTWQATPRERNVAVAYDLSLGADFSQIPLHLGNWSGEDIPQTNLEVFQLLEPEQYLFRLYRHQDGTELWLSVLGSRQARSFHPPQICYAADGWTTKMESQRVPLQHGDLWMMNLMAHQSPHWQTVLYVYLWPSPDRRPSDGTVLLKVTSPLATADPETIDKTMELQAEFLRQIFLGGQGQVDSDR